MEVRKVHIVRLLRDFALGLWVLKGIDYHVGCIGWMDNIVWNLNTFVFDIVKKKQTF